MRTQHFLFIGCLAFFLVSAFACQPQSPQQKPDQADPASATAPTTSPATDPVPATPPSLPISPPKWELEAHYFLNNKQHQEIPQKKLAAWRTELLRGKLNGTDAAYDLFSHKGGGPNGAEWNTDADIVLVLTARDLEPGIPVSVHMKLNEGAYRAKSVVEENDNQAFFSLEIPASVWLPRLRKIRSTDYPLLYDSQTINSASNDPNSSLGTGKVLVTELLVTTNEGQNIKAHIKRAFHHATGE